jgi:hypothetical protein
MGHASMQLNRRTFWTEEVEGCVPGAGAGAATSANQLAQISMLSGVWAPSRKKVKGAESASSLLDGSAML